MFCCLKKMKQNVVVADTGWSQDEAIEEALLTYVEHLNQSDYTVEAQINGKLASAILALGQKLRREAMDDLDRGVAISIQTSETISLSAHMLSDLRAVSGQVQSIAAAAEEMVASVKEIGRNGENISVKAEETEQATASGTQSVSVAQMRVDDIAKVVTDTVGRVERLNGFTAQITQIADVIKKIAAQTNLLALNATIEAARAGEAGRGFAVVAGEVKNLSGQTTQATQQIDELVKDLQEEMKQIMQIMHDSKQAVGAGREAIESVGASMSDIRTRSSEVRQNTSQISHILDQQAEASTDVARGINDITAKTQVSVKSLENILDAIGVIEKMVADNITALAQKNMPNKVVKLAKSDHVLWKKRLANMLCGREQLDVSTLTSDHNCRLGLWYDKATESCYLDNPAFKLLPDPHRGVHEHGKEAVRLFNAGKLEEALYQVDLVTKASEEVLKYLSALERPCE